MALLPPDPVYCLKSPDLSPFHSLCFHTSERIYAGTGKGTVQLWDLHTNRSPYQLPVGPSPVIALDHTEDVALLTQEKNDCVVKLWQLTNSAYVESHQVSTDHVGFCRFVYNPSAVGGPAVIVPRGGSNISILCGRTMAERQLLAVEDGAGLPPLGTVMCFLPVQLGAAGVTYLLAGYESGTLVLWDLNCSKVVSHLKLATADDECLMTLDYDPVTNRGVAGGSSDRITVFSLDRATGEIRRKSDIGIKNAGVHRVRIRKDLKVFSSAGWDGRIRIFSWKSLRPLAVLTEHRGGELLDLAYSEDKVSMWKAPIMAAAGSDGQISLWDLYN
ncbi:guanine nucleotide-binding protein subunit beta-like protein 1 [Culex pipiens pallens]|uniref:guanine nucleotide-binding protein subunit beta-like protein 1 n=1 Tax=Culex pipiens pallens TaxID=42434 RepID=UPI001954E64B|nr:guanine nucleotide-binding protein subunit beta-like protein 1 [Culex pipiens pallens]